VQSTTKKSGNYALKISHAASADHWFAAPSAFPDGVWTVCVFISSLPGADVVTAQIGQNAGTERRCGVGIRASGKWAAFLKLNGTIFWGADGPAVATGQWVRLDILCQRTVVGPPETHTVDFMVDGTPGPQGTGTSAAATSSFSPVILGNQSGVTGNTGTYDEYFDDLALWIFGAGSFRTYPVGEGSVIILVPDGEGTHSNAASFTDDSANSPPVTPQTRLDEVPTSSMADYVDQTTLGGGDYIELTMSDIAIQGVADCVYPIASFVAADGSATAFVRAFHVIDVNDASADITIFGGSVSASVKNYFGPSTQVPRGAGSASTLDWTTADVNQLKARIGYSTDVSPNPRFHNVFFEVHVRQALGIGSWQIVD